MSPSKKFSVRQGIEPEPKPILADVPQGVRYFLLKYLEKKYMQYPSLAGEILEDFLRQPGLKRKFYNPHDPGVWARLYEYIEGFEWRKVYDFMEAIHAGERTDYLRRDFREKLNEVLAEENCCWRMDYNGEIIYQGSEAFVSAVQTATSLLAAAGRNTARDEMHKALNDLSKRPQPDLTGAVQHAVAALECVAADVCGAEGETLGQIVKRYPDKFPPPLGQAVSMLYGFASDRGRHLTEGGEPALKEVELIVGIAATVATYLSR